MDNFYKIRVNNSTYIVNSGKQFAIFACTILTQYFFGDPKNESLHPQIFYPKVCETWYNCNKYCFVKVEKIEEKDIDPKAKIITMGIYRIKKDRSKNNNYEN